MFFKVIYRKKLLVKYKYTSVRKPKMVNKKYNICGRWLNTEDITHGCERCNWEKDGVDVVTPYWIKYHESKGHFKTAPCQYSTSSTPVWITKNGKKKRIA